MGTVKTLARFLSSNGLAVVLCLHLLLLTYLGTMYQAEQGLYAARQKYFDAWIVVNRIRETIPIPMPGALLTLVLLGINLLFGGLLYPPKGWARLGLLTTHAGIALLLLGICLGGLFTKRGSLTLEEGQSAAVFESPGEWELALFRAHKLILSFSEETLAELLSSGQATPVPDRQFRIAIKAYELNGELRPAGPLTPPGAAVSDGQYLQPLARERDPVNNTPGVCYAFLDEGGNEISRGLLWGPAQRPRAIQASGEEWVVALRRRQYPLPFVLQLNRFEHAFFPGTQMPRFFASHVTMESNGARQETLIAMNEPLRQGDCTVYQTSWGPPGAPGGAKKYSVFAVVRNPLSWWPTYACGIIAFGLILHFAQRLLRPNAFRETGGGGA